MLTTKQLARNVFLTYCSTSNTMFKHCSKTKAQNVSANTVQAVKRNVSAQVLQQYKLLPALYNLYSKNKSTKQIANNLINSIV
jgi:hypothetical protein